MPSDYIEINGLDRLLSRFSRAQRSFFSRELMSEIGHYLIFSIGRRTAAGTGVDGAAFKPYSPKWRKFRQDTGHPVDKVNLFYTGSMMSAMTFKNTADKVEVYFLNTASKPIKHKSKRTGRTATRGGNIKNPQKAFYLHKQRPFFAISAEEQRRIFDMVERYIDNLLF